VRSQIWPEAALLLTYWAVRLHHLTAYPVFDDEAGHIRQAKMVWKLLPFSGADDGRVLNILLYAPFWPFGDGALWVSRAAYLMAGAAGFAALLCVGRILFGASAGRWAGVAFILMPFAFFFERIALADTLGIPFVALVALFSLRAAARSDRWVLLAGGLSLAALFLSKLTNLLFGFVPVLWLWWFLRSPVGSRRPGLWSGPVRRVIATYLIAAAALAPIVLFLVFRAHSTLGFANVAVRTEAAPLAERLARQFGTLSEYPAAYLTWPIAALCLLGLGLGLLAPRIVGQANSLPDKTLMMHGRGVLYILALIAVPLLAFVIGANSLESRYLAPLAPGLALLAGVGAAGLSSSLSRLPRLATHGLVLAAMGLGGSFQFMWAGWYAPEKLALPASDQPDYIFGWPSGFGVDAAERYVLERAAQGPVAVVLTEGWHMTGLSVHYGWEQNLHSMYAFSEERLQLVWLQSGCDPFALVEEPAPAMLLVTQRRRYAEMVECLQAEKTLLASFSKPGDADSIDVYEIRPLPQ
jgi:4-amino-4-deoxy-L-arabinose transferase-like glycosyltransferase